MSQTDNQALDSAARKTQAEADAVLEQMFGYFTREYPPSPTEIIRRAA